MPTLLWGFTRPATHTALGAGLGLLLTASLSTSVSAQTLHARSSASIAPAIASNSARPQAKLDDATIVAIFDAANTWDIETGGMAVKTSHDKEVKEFGAMLVRDHKVVRQQGRDLAKKLGVQPTPPKDFAMAKDHAAAVKKLRGLRGAAFDKAFLENEVAYHKAVIDAITTTLLPAIQNAELKALVTTVAPAFQAHMIKAQQLLDARTKPAK